MKLKKYFLFKTLLTFLFMLIVFITTICYLYNTININKDDYFKLLLTDTYGYNFYIKIVEIINEYLNPFNIIELNEVEVNSFNLSNEYVDYPLIYIINSNQESVYKEEYNITPTVLYTSYFLSNKLNEFNINTIFEENKINNKEEYNLYINEKKETYKSLKYIFNININNNKKNIINCDKRYAVINMYVSDKNIELISKVSSNLNKMCFGISKIYVDYEYDDVINIDFGGINNSMKEVVNSVNLFSYVLKEVI